MTTIDPEKARAFRRTQCDRLDRYLRLSREQGEDAAREELLRGYPELQRAKMGPLIKGVPLVKGFEKAVPLFAAIGVTEEVVDISSAQSDAVLEIATTCMCRNAAADLGQEEARPVLCELDFEATRRAFPDLSARAERQQAAGDQLCIFRYSRPWAAPMSES